MLPFIVARRRKAGKNGEARKRETTINLCSSHMYQWCSNTLLMPSHLLCLDATSNVASYCHWSPPGVTLTLPPIVAILQPSPGVKMLLAVQGKEEKLEKKGKAKNRKSKLPISHANKKNYLSV